MGFNAGGRVDTLGENSDGKLAWFLVGRQLTTGR